MIGAETWQAGPSNRTCEGSYFQHPMSAADYSYQSAITTYGGGTIPAQTGPIYYDEKGHCTPYSPVISVPIETGSSIWSLIFWAGLSFGAYYLWTHRKKIF